MKMINSQENRNNNEGEIFPLDNIPDTEHRTSDGNADDGNRDEKRDENLDEIRLASTVKNDVPVGNDQATILDCILPSIGILLHSSDIVLNVCLAYEYLLTRKMWYFGLTITFTFLPSIINMLISFRIRSVKKSRKTEGETGTIVAWEQKRWSVIVIHISAVAPILYMYNSGKNAFESLKCKKKGDRNGQQHRYRKMLDVNKELALLRIFSAFFGAAPQQIIQLFILLNDDYDSIFKAPQRIISLCTSFLAISWTITNYDRTIHLAEAEKSTTGSIGINESTFRSIWNLCITVSRIASIGIIASMWPLVTILCCFVHSIAMTYLLIVRPYGITSVLFVCLYGVFYIFIHMNPRENNSFYKDFFYYSFCAIENIAATILWATFSNPVIKSYWYFTLLNVLCIAPYFIGILLMIIYYKLFQLTSAAVHLNLRCQTACLCSN